MLIWNITSYTRNWKYWKTFSGDLACALIFNFTVNDNFSVYNQICFKLKPDCHLLFIVNFHIQEFENKQNLTKTKLKLSLFGNTFSRSSRFLLLKNYKFSIFLTNIGSIPVKLIFWTYFMPPILQSSAFLILDRYCHHRSDNDIMILDRCRSEVIRGVLLASAISSPLISLM